MNNSVELTEEIATVSFIKGHYAYLKASSVSACSSCSASSSCGAKTISNSDSSYSLRVKNTLDLKEGESVILGIKSKQLLLGTVMLYLLPLCVLFLFSFIGKLFFGELASIGGGILGLIVGLVILRYLSKGDRIEKQFEPVIIRKY